MHQFLDWMHSNWYFSAPATILAAKCFSGRPPRDILKDLHHRDRRRALRGLCNCAWDLTYATYWGQSLKRQSDENRIYIFCSRDKALRQIAHLLLAESHFEDADIQQTLWETLGVSVYGHYVDLVARENDPGGAVNRSAFEAEKFGE